METKAFDNNTLTMPSPSPKGQKKALQRINNYERGVLILVT
jgi:hypothetical protein